MALASQSTSCLQKNTGDTTKRKVFIIRISEDVAETTTIPVSKHDDVMT